MCFPCNVIKKCTKDTKFVIARVKLAKRLVELNDSTIRHKERASGHNLRGHIHCMVYLSKLKVYSYVRSPCEVHIFLTSSDHIGLWFCTSGACF